MIKKLTMFVVVLPLIFLCSCSGRTYNYKFDQTDIKEIKIILKNADDIMIGSDLFDKFFDSLKLLNYKSYFGDIRGKEMHSIQIILEDESKYIFEAYYIIKNEKKSKYKCDAIEYNNFIAQYLIT